MWPLPCLSSVDILCIIMSAPKTNIAMLYTKLWILKYYSRVRNKRSPMIINFLTFFQGLRPYSGLP